MIFAPDYDSLRENVNGWGLSVKKAAIVTGGAKRIGRAIALMLADKGYHIALHYHTSESTAIDLAADIRATGQDCCLFQCDLNDFPQVTRLIPDIFKKFPETSLLVNNASMFERSRLMETTEELFDSHFNINLKAPFFLSQYFARESSAEQIINILDTKVARTLIEYFVYTMTKKSLFEFTKMAAKELAPRIRVNGIGPGLILPPLGEDQTYLSRLSEKIPLKKAGEVDNVLSAISFLLDNAFITGECIYVDGGEHLN